MADSENCDTRLLNPWLLDFKKLGLQLKCPLCRSLLNRPTSLPCNHVFCNSCISGSTSQSGAVCPVCKSRFVDKDLRHLPFMENMLTTYKCLDATFSANLFQLAHLDAEMVSMQSPTSSNIRFADKMNEELHKNPQVDNSHSGESIDKQFEVDMNGKVENRECARNDEETVYSVARNYKLSSSRSNMRSGATEGCMTQDIDTNPSFGDARGSDDDCYYRCSEHSSESSLLKRPSQEDNSSRIGKLRNDGSGFGEDDNYRKVKRHKQLTNSEPKLQTKSQPSVKEHKILDSQFANKFICAFCHSSEITEDTGTMLHYSSGKMVIGYEATLPDVIHVHKVCFDWAPQVYHIGDKAQKLKEEVARGAKLKCSGCGKKGAALGCYVRSCRRSYHVPCAMNISKCRWAYEDYLMLCPAHSSVRFPNEKSKFRKNISGDHNMPTIMSCQLSTLPPSPDGDNKLLFCGSALSTEEMIILVKSGKLIGGTVSKFWNPNVTHVIAATDNKGACTRTLKFLMAILTGSWIVKVDWIKACLQAKCHVNEEPYEVRFDNYGCRDGPKTGRLRASNNAPKLFSGLSFYFLGDFLASYKEDLQDLVIAAGGTFLQSREELVAQSCGETAPKPGPLVVYNRDPPEGCTLGEEAAVLFQRLSEAENIASQIGSKVISHTSLLESIAGHKLQPVVI